MKILATGGAGYIGAHIVVELLAAGHEAVVLDNFSNAAPAAIAALRRVAGRDIPFVQADVRDAAALDRIFAGHGIDAVIHLAALKAVGESVDQPLLYYDNNVAGTVCLAERMAAHGVKTLVFSSSATVYGAAARMPIAEDAPTAPTNPYGHTKLFIEQVLADVQASDPDWRISILRYFNPAGAHPSGDIGEDAGDAPNNLLPYIGQVATGRRDRLRIFGNDYPTPDGTGVRDYLHIVDLARGHVDALAYLERNPGLRIHNLGTGRGYSVLEVLRAFEQASGLTIPHEIAPRREGDIAVSYTDPARAAAELGWRAQFGLDRMCMDLWRWLQRHPNGYAA